MYSGLKFKRSRELEPWQHLLAKHSFFSGAGGGGLVYRPFCGREGHRSGVGVELAGTSPWTTAGWPVLCVDLDKPLVEFVEVSLAVSSSFFWVFFYFIMKCMFLELI